MISIVMLTKDASKTIKAALEALKDFDEVVIVDTGSKDMTLDIAKNFKNVKIEKCRFSGFGTLRNYGAEKARHDWILAIDSDEVITKDLREDILNAKLDPETAYGFHFLNFYNKTLIKGCGWHPEKHLRLYNRKHANFSENQVHEKLQIKTLKVNIFKSFVLHYPYRTTEDFLQKMNKYSTLFAKQHKNKKKSSLTKAILHGLFAFFKSYIIKKGFLIGKKGFIISVYNANTAFYKYLKLAEINSEDQCF